MAKKRGGRTVVGSPITPSLLSDIGALAGFRATPAGFDPRGDWVNTYRIWTCHGYRESGNMDVGVLRLERAASRPGRKNGTFTLKAEQRVVNDEGAVHVTLAEITCRTDEIASPVRWDVTSRLVAPDGKPRDDLETHARVAVEGESLSVETGGRVCRRKGSTRLTGDWCVFEAIQRLPFREGAGLSFDMMEGMSLFKEGHRLSYRGTYRAKLKAGNASLHWFHQIGYATLPYEYWLDARHRLVMAATLSRAYVLDDEAERKVERREESTRRIYKSRRQSRKGGEAK